MILDSLENIEKYKAIVPKIDELMNEIQQQMKTEVGRYELNHGYYIIQTGNTSSLDEGYFEAHEKFIDIQILISGEEIVEWANTKSLVIYEPYNVEKDFKLLKASCIL